MTVSQYISQLPTAAARLEACALHGQWWSWYMDEWTAEDEREWNRVIYLEVLAEVEMGSTEYTDEDLENYRQTAEEEAA